MIDYVCCLFQSTLFFQQTDSCQQFAVPLLSETADQRFFQKLINVQAESFARGFCLKNHPKISFSPLPTLQKRQINMSRQPLVLSQNDNFLINRNARYIKNMLIYNNKQGYFIQYIEIFTIFAQEH